MTALALSSGRPPRGTWDPRGVRREATLGLSRGLWLSSLAALSIVTLAGLALRGVPPRIVEIDGARILPPIAPPILAPPPVATPEAPSVAPARPGAVPVPTPGAPEAIEDLMPSGSAAAGDRTPGAEGGQDSGVGGRAVTTDPANSITFEEFPDEYPELVQSGPVEYPPLARDAGVEGTVLVAALVDADGHVMDCRVESSIPLLDEAAMAAVRTWRYSPARSAGHAVRTWVRQPVRFKLHF